MKVKKLFDTSSRFPNNCVIEDVNGEFKTFTLCPSRKVTEKELKPLPGFKPVGNVGKEAPEYFYKMYGLEKI